MIPKSTFCSGRFSGLDEVSSSVQTPKQSEVSDLDFVKTPTASIVGDASHDCPDQDETPEDVDSLDDGLGAFEDHPTHSQLAAHAESSQTVLPTHNGFGLFPGSNSPVQHQIWQHEQYNPQRTEGPQLQPGLRSRQNSPNNGVQALSQQEKNQRIENWRLEQSQNVLAEIRKATSRRRRRRRTPVAIQGVDADASPESTPTENLSAPLDPVARHIIRSIMRVDDETLFLIFGESVAPAAAQRSPEVQACVKYNPEPASMSIFSQIARQLGDFVHQISSQINLNNPQPWANESVPCASIPTSARFDFEASRPSFRASAEQSAALDQTTGTAPLPSRAQRRRTSSVTTASVVSERRVEAQEVRQHPRRRHRIPRRTSYTRNEAAESPPDVQYWEQDLDVKLVFSFIRSRVASPRIAATPATPFVASRPSRFASLSDSLRRAALIRHQHPLIASPLPSTASHASTMSPLSQILGRRQSCENESVVGGSCATQSKKSKTSHSRSISLGSSRNYWDFGGGWDGGSWGGI